jgi:hypothetical protein
MIERLPRSFLSADLAVVLVGRAALACPSRTCHNRPSTLPRRDDDGPEKGGEEWFIEVPTGGRSKSRPNCWSFRISRRRMGPSDPNFVVVVASYREELTHDDVGEEKIQKAVRCEDRRR